MSTPNGQDHDQTPDLEIVFEAGVSVPTTNSRIEYMRELDRRRRGGLVDHLRSISNEVVDRPLPSSAASVALPSELVLAESTPGTTEAEALLNLDERRTAVLETLGSLTTEPDESGVPLMADHELSRLGLTTGQERGTQEEDPTSVQPILSSIRDLRSALHERVLNLGDEVERLRARASAVQQGYAEARIARSRADADADSQATTRLREISDDRRSNILARRQASERPEGQGEREATPEDSDPVGVMPGPWSFIIASERLSSNLARSRDRPVQAGLEDSDPARVPAPWRIVGQGVNRLSSEPDPVRDRERQETKYEIVRGSGSKEIEGSKEERRQKRLHQVQLESVSSGSTSRRAAVLAFRLKVCFK